ncbi:MAG: hypothetical protein AAGP08_01505 [Pseudomonadota bacterium]
MTIETAIYAGGGFCFGEDWALQDMAAAKFDTLLIWSVHVDSTGNLALNNNPLVNASGYHDYGMDLAARLAKLRNGGPAQGGTRIGFSVGSGGTSDWTNIYNLVKNGAPAKGQPLYDNFATLLSTMQAVTGGGIDFIDFDCEDASGDNLTTAVTNFAQMLGDVGYANVSFCPSFPSEISYWQTALQNLVTSNGAGFVRALNIQFYSGGAYNTVKSWTDVVANTGSSALVIPGLSTNNAEPGPWWYTDPSGKSAMGGTVVKTPGVAQYGKGDWSGKLRVENHASAEDALKAAGTQDTFFFHCNGPLDLGAAGSYTTGDTVYFIGPLRWGSAGQADGYALSGSKTVNAPNYGGVGGCPDQLQGQYKTWSGDTVPPDGGFIWMYDSILSTGLTPCCGGSETAIKATASEYRQAITNGLSGS